MTIKFYRTNAYKTIAVMQTDFIYANVELHDMDDEMREQLNNNECTPMISFESEGGYYSVPVQFLISITE